MGKVGPYEYTVIAALPSDPTGDALFSWLNSNGFDQPPSSKPIVARYVSLKHRFVTLKLQKGKSSGELVPVRCPCAHVFVCRADIDDNRSRLF